MRGASNPIVDHDAVLECARRLVREPSENPPGNEAGVAGVAERLCKDAGLIVERIEPAPGRVNLIATLDSGSSGRTLAFNGHLDVVPIVDESLWEHPPFEAHVAQGLLHGRGSADMKGAIAAAIAAAHALRDVDFNGKLVLQLVADEEVFGPLGTARHAGQEPDQQRLMAGIEPFEQAFFDLGCACVHEAPLIHRRGPLGPLGPVEVLRSR